MMLDDVLAFDAELCAFGATVTDGPDSLILHAKPVRWVTNSRYLKESLSRRCTNYSCSRERWPRHAKGVNSKYPPRLVSAILASVRQELISGMLIIGRRLVNTLANQMSGKRMLVIIQKFMMRSRGFI